MSRWRAEQPLSRLVAPRRVGEVLSEVWPSQAAVFRGPPDRCPELFSAPELQSLDALLQTGAATELWWEEGGRLASAVADPKGAAALWARGGFTLRLAAVDAAVPAIRRLLDHMAAELQTPVMRSYANVYASGPGAATSPHFDGSEVFIAQVRGRKTWRTAPNRAVQSPGFAWSGEALEPEQSAQLLQPLAVAMPPDAQTHALEPGDVLFVPRGWWHAAEAAVESISVSLTFECATVLDMAVAALRRALIADPSWRRPAAGLLGEGEARAAFEAELRALGRSLAGPAE